MATLQLTVEQVNFDAEDLLTTPYDFDDPISKVIDPNVDFSSSQTPSISSLDKNYENHETSSSTNEINESPIVVDDSINSDFISPRCHSSLPEVHRNKIFPSSIHSTRNHSVSDSTSYPAISSEVAKHLCKVNPHLLQNMEITLSNLKSAKLPEASAVSKNTNSSLIHLTNTSDALALQETVIGNRSLQPASPEVVAQIVANVHRQVSYQEESNNMQNNSTYCIPQDRVILYDKTSLVSDVNNRKEPNMNENAMMNERWALNSVKDSAVLSRIDGIDHQDAKLENGKELHRFPSDRIITITEKKSWFSSASSDSNPNDGVSQLILPDPKSRRKRSSRQSCSSRCSSLSTQDSSFHENILAASGIQPNGITAAIRPETEMMLAMKSTKNKSETHSTYSEIDSNYSEKFELDSNYSERFETLSNFSEMSSVSGIEEEMYRIKKLLLEVPSLPDDHPDFQKHSVLLGKTAGVVVSGCPEMARAVVDQEVFFELQRQKANLEGQLEYLKTELEEVSREKTSLQSRVVSLQGRLKSKTVETQLSTTEKENLTSKVNFLQDGLRNSEITISQLRYGIESKTSAIDHLKEDLKEVEELNAKLKVDNEELKMNTISKDSAIQGLKNKIAELHVELQMLNQEKIHIDNNYKSLKSDVEALSKSREWYQQQLHVTQDSLAKLQQDYVTLQASSVNQGGSVEKLRAENVHLRQQLVDTQQRAVKEKEVLMRHLQTIEADMLEREAMFEQIQKDKGIAEETLMSRMKKIEEEKSKLSNYVFNVADLEHQLESSKKEIKTKQDTITKLEKEFAELMKQFVISQKTIADQNLATNNIEQKCIQLEHKYKECQNQVANREEYLASLREEKMALEIMLASTNKEKLTIDDALQNVKENLQKLDANFKKMKAELANKSAMVEQLQRENRKLEEQTMIAEQHSQTVQRNYESYSTDIQERDTTIDNLSKQYSKQLGTLSSTEEELKRCKSELSQILNQKQALDESISLLKQENASKSEELQKALIERQEMEKRLKMLEAEIEGLKDDIAPSIKKKISLDSTSSESKIIPLQKMLEEKQKLRDDLLNLHCSIQNVQNAVGNKRERRNSQDLSDGTRILHDPTLEDKNLLMNLDVSLVKEFVEQELKKIQSALEGNEEKIETYLEEKRSLELTVEKLLTENKLLRREINLRETTNGNSDESLIDDMTPLTKQIEAQLEVYRRKVLELEEVLNISKNGVDGDGAESGKRTAVEVDTQTDNVSFMKHIIQQDEELLSESSYKQTHLESAITVLEQQHKERSRVFESNIKLLTRKLKESMKAKKKAEADLKQLKEQQSNYERNVNDSIMSSQLPNVSCELHKQNTNENIQGTPPLSHSKQRELKREIFHNRAKIKDLQMRLATMQEMYEEMKRKADANEALALELEKEKGRLAGVSQNNQVLKQQTSELEVALAEREIVMSELDITAKNLAHLQQSEESQRKERLQELENSLAAEQEVAKELRKQVFNAKRESSGLKKQISSLRTGLENANHMIEGKMEEIKMLQNSLEQNNEMKARLQAQVDSMAAEHRQMRKDIEGLKKKELESETKDSLIAEQMKNMGWHMRQKNQELEALREQLTFIENRHKNEMENLKKILDVTKEELARTKKELSAVMEEKFDYQNKVTELRAALKSSVEKNMIFKAQISEDGIDGISHDFLMNLKLPDSPTPCDDKFIAHLLEQSAVMPQSRPLTNLQLCLHTLKEEMEILQQQLQENT